MITTTYSLSDILSKQKQEFLSFAKKKYFIRTKEAELVEALDNSLIKIVLGPRRAGKSRLIQKILEDKKIAYLNFEEELFQKSSGDSIIDTAHEIYPDAQYWYLDEIQDFPEWETLINKLHRRGYNLVITGSNAKLLGSELATALTGRHIAIELLPFSYTEYIDATNRQRSWDSYQFYLERGGYPEVLFEPSVDYKTYLKALYDSVILKDLVRRKKIRNPFYLTNTLSLIVGNVSARTSARALSKALDSTPSATTIENYLRFMEEAYLVETTHNFSHKIKERIKGERKPYLIDTGIISALNLSSLPVLGKQLENSVYLHLRRSGYKSDSSIFYHRLDDGKEIDFLVRDGHVTSQLIQVCLNISDMETKEREVRALEIASTKFSEAKLTIVTANESGGVKGSGKQTILMIPAYEYCR
jgi:predicted AAA+ superfamily ATPase